MFNENSGLVQVWVRLIKQGLYTINNVSNLSNLREAVSSILNNE